MSTIVLVETTNMSITEYVFGKLPIVSCVYTEVKLVNIIEME